MKQVVLFLTMLFFLSSAAFAQKDTVYVPGYFETTTYGTLNDAIEAAVTAGTINNTVFKLNHYEAYVLSRSIYMDHGQNLEIVADKAGADQNGAPPQIVWTEEEIDRAYIIQTYGDLVMKNIWVRYADFLGNKVGGSITFENQEGADDPEVGDFDGCIFDYCGIGAESAGALCIKADHFEGTFENCYWRNNVDNHFRYYGRAISFPYESTGWHYDKLLFENCTFSNLSRIVMQEGNEFGSNIHINHCTLVNSVEWVWQSAGWLETASITNSIFVNPYMFGYRAVDVCDMGQNGTQDYGDFEDGLCDPPGGGLINGIIEVDSMGFAVNFTDDDRKLFIGNNAYMYHDWFVDWYTSCPWAADKIRNRLSEDVYHPAPMIGQDAIDYIDSTDADGNKVFTKLNVDWATIYDEDPQFIVEPTNVDTLKLFMQAKWDDNADFDWSYKPWEGLDQIWPLSENLAYNNTAYQTAAMGDFPLGDLNWYPEQKAAWEAQKDAEWTVINNWLNSGNPSTGIADQVNEIPSDFTLSQNYPNPFNPTTRINYSIPTSGFVSLKVYNLLGQEVATIFEGNQQPGNYDVTFNGANLASGVYTYRLQGENVSITKKFVLMK
jgi:hypothetical protein